MKILWSNKKFRNHMSKVHMGKPGYWLGKKRDKETIEKMSKSFKKVIRTKEWNKNISKSLKGKSYVDLMGKEKSEVIKNLRRLTMIKNLKKRWSPLPNKVETQLLNILNLQLPNEYKYVGKGQLILDGLNPDFVNINGQKKIIELYGDYWHNLPHRKITDSNRLKTYRKYGYKTLIIWQHELKDSNKLKRKICKFNKK